MEVLIVDREKKSRSLLRQMCLELNPECRVLEAQSGEQAKEYIGKKQPDILFSDVDLGDMTLFQLLKTSVGDATQTIVHTDSWQYGKEAWMSHARGYLLKPLNKDLFHRLMKSITTPLIISNQKNKNDIKVETAEKQNSSFNDTNQEKFIISLQHKEKVILGSEVVYFSSSNRITQLFTKEMSYGISESLSDLEKRLNPDHFIRIRRNGIINIQKVESWKRDQKLTITMNNGYKLQVPKARRSFVLNRLRSLNATTTSKKNKKFQKHYKVGIDKALNEVQIQWFNFQTPFVYRDVRHLVKSASKSDKIPIIVCSQLTTSSKSDKAPQKKKIQLLEKTNSHKLWTREVSRGIGPYKAIVILEPKTLSLAQATPSIAIKNKIIDIINDAIQIFKKSNNVSIYLDISSISLNLIKGSFSSFFDLHKIDGFFLDKEASYSIEDRIEKGRAISSLLDHKPFLIEKNKDESLLTDLKKDRCVAGCINLE